MPLPVMLLGVGAAALGTGTGIHGAVMMKDADSVLKTAQERYQGSLENFKKMNILANQRMDALGTLELRILSGFKDFSDTMGKIQNRPQFKEYHKESADLPVCDMKELEKVHVRAGMLLGSLVGAALGTVGGLAAAGMTTSVVMAFGTASTGTAISTLSGAAAANAALAALGGGTVAAGGGGMALGATVLGVSSLGTGMLAGGVLFDVIGRKLSDQAHEAYDQAFRTEELVNKICVNLSQIAEVAAVYYHILEGVQEKYLECFEYVSCTVNHLHKEDWNRFDDWEKNAVQNTIMLVSLLYKMCKVNLVKQDEYNHEMCIVNQKGVEEAVQTAGQVLSTVS